MDLSTPLSDALLAEMEIEAVTVTDTGVSLTNANRLPPSWSARPSSYSMPCKPPGHNLPRQSPHRRCVCSSSVGTPSSWGLALRRARGSRVGIRADKDYLQGRR